MAVYHESESISHLSPKIWDILPTSFKQVVKNWFYKYVSVGSVRTTYQEYVLLKAYYKKVPFLIIDFPNIFIPMVQLVFAVFLFFMTYLETK